MRGVIGRRFSNPNNVFTLTSIVKQTPFLIQPTSHFSSSSDGAGRGRGRGSGFDGGRGQFGINRDSEKVNEPLGNGRGSPESQSPGGFGHGRGRPIQSDSISPPSFSSFVRPGPPSVGRGRGSAGSDSVSPFAADPPPLHPPHQPRFQPQQPPSQFPPQQQRLESARDEFQGSSRPQFSRENQPPSPHQQRFQPQQPPSPFPPQQQRLESAKDEFQGSSNPQLSRENQPTSQQPLRPPIKEAASSPQPPPPEFKPGQAAPATIKIFNALGSEFSHPNQRIVPGSGAGRGKPMVDEENRHIRRPQPQPQQQQRPYPQKQQAQTPTPWPQLSREEAGRRARSELSRGDAEGGGVRGGRGGGRGRGRGARGRGRGGRGGEAWRDDKKEEEAEEEAIKMFVGDSADGEKFAKKIGPEMMESLVNGFEDVCDKALPSTQKDALLDAYETNLMIECEPEYLMPDFKSNPDIDEKPPMSLRECLEKVKPFIVAYEGIKDQEEWEEAIDEVMAQAPLIKEIVDHYSGPDRVTAKKQNEELDRIATTLPKSAPDSVKRFADRAALSLKSNPGWGFDKKYQFMDKLVLEVSQSYK